MPSAETLQVYWPAAAAGGAFLLVIVALISIARSLPKVKPALDIIAKSRKELNEARVQAKASIARVKTRRAEIQALHQSASKQFWRAEKTWIG